MFAVTTDAFTGADLAGFIGEVWPGLVQEQLFAKAVAANFFLDLSQYGEQGGDVIHVPDAFTNAFSAQTQSTQGAEITTAGPAQVDTTLSTWTHSYVAFIMGDKDVKQIMKNYPYNKIYTKKCAGTLRIVLEDALFGLWSGLTTNVIGDTATVLADPEIRQGINALEAYDVDTLDGDTAFFFHPYTFYVQLGAISKYYDASQWGRGSLTATGMIGGEGNRAAGQKGSLYGITTYTSSRVVSGLQTYRNLLAHREAFGFATQTLNSPNAGGEGAENSRVRAQINYELRNLGWLTVVDMLAGVVELRDPLAVVLNGSSSFIGS